MKLLCLLLITCVIPAHAQIAGQEAAFMRKAAQWMASTEASKRQAAYTTWLQMGPNAMPKYRTSLDAAKLFHEKAIGKLCIGSTNPYAAHQTIAEELDTERQRIMPLIKTDWKKDPKEIAKLRNEMATLQGLLEKTQRAGKVSVERFDATIGSHLDALVEIAREIERFEPDAETADWDDASLRDEIIDEHFDASELEDQRRRFAKTTRAIADFKKAKTDNQQAGNWANGAMKVFAEILNAERAMLGLGPLRLEERLSAAAEGHSKDMARLGFFAHESPVPNKKSPWDRARLAKFEGRASGENIFMGSASPQAAYNGWFGSDGHRFIMMASGPNVLAVGIAGRHWTMMTGKQ